MSLARTAAATAAAEALLARAPSELSVEEPAPRLRFTIPRKPAQFLAGFVCMCSISLAFAIWARWHFSPADTQNAGEFNFRTWHERWYEAASPNEQQVESARAHPQLKQVA